MERICINLYSIDELSPEAQKSAFEKYRYYNVTEYNWYDSTYDDFIYICSEIGIEVNYEDIAFSGFWSQGDGSTFTSSINLLELISGIEKKAWKEHAPTLNLNVPPCPCNSRIIQLLKAGHITSTLQTKAPVRGYYIEYLSEYSICEPDTKQYPNVENELKKLDAWAEHALNILNKHLYSTLEATYEYLISNEALTEAFNTDLCLFTKDGHMADYLLQLAIEQ
jgi:hypothetical protein